MTNKPKVNKVIFGFGSNKSSSLGFGLLCLLIICVGMVLLLMLNIRLQSSGFEVSAAQSQVKELDNKVGILENKVLELGSTVQIAEKATALGMVPNNSAVYLKMPSGEILSGPQTGVEVVKKS